MLNIHLSGREPSNNFPQTKKRIVYAPAVLRKGLYQLMKEMKENYFIFSQSLSFQNRLLFLPIQEGITSLRRLEYIPFS